MQRARTLLTALCQRWLFTPPLSLIPGLLLGLGGVLGCNDLSKLAGTQTLPSGTVDPSAYHTPAGARELYQNAMDNFLSAANDGGTFVNFVLMSGLLTDELQAGNLGATGSAVSGGDANQIDARQLPEGGTVGLEVYSDLQKFRSLANLGIGALLAYDDTAPTALRGQLYALQGYSELFLADLFCSGIPLSTLDFNEDYTYHDGSTSAQVYADARAKFDTALTLAGDSAQVLNLARVGKGRAWLALGQFDSAAAAVAAVPTGFTYQIANDWSYTEFDPNRTVTFTFPDGSTKTGTASDQTVTVSDHEGGTGLPFRSNHDPRDSVEQTGVNAFGVAQYAPLKYGGGAVGTYVANVTGVVAPIPVADWIEARLITAEAALPMHGSAKWGNWLQVLNTLRQTVIVPGQTQPLPQLTDPGNDSARVSLLFQERAYWLFVTGHRQGDLRRLIRQYGTYGFSAATVYPTGAYPLAPVISAYGNYVNIPVPNTEHINPKFAGCLSRGA